MEAFYKKVSPYFSRIVVLFLSFTLALIQTVNFSSLLQKNKLLSASDLIKQRKLDASPQINVSEIYKEYTDIANQFQQNILPLIPTITPDLAMQYCIKIEPTKQLVEYPSDIAKIKLGVAFFNTNNSTSSEILIATMDKKTVCSKTKINYNVTSLGNIIYPDTLTYNSNSKDPYHSTPLAYLAQQGTDSAFLKFTFETQVRYFTLRFMIDLFVIVNIISVYIFFFRVKTNLKK